MSVVEQDPVGTQNTSENVAFAWRQEQYEAMGFNEAQATALAGSTETNVTKDAKGKKLEWHPPIYHGKIKKALDAGATHEQVIQIFANDDETP